MSILSVEPVPPELLPDGLVGLEPPQAVLMSAARTGSDRSRNRTGFLDDARFSKFDEKGADLTPGTYAVGPTDTNANYVLVGGTGIWSAIPGVNGSPSKGSGSVVLTAFSKTSKTASGTFSFVLSNGSSTKTVTNGIFNVTFK